MTENQLNLADYKTLFNQTLDGMLLIQNGKFTQCNPAACQILGYKYPSQLLDLHPSKISPAKQPDGASSVQKAEELMQIALDQGHHRFEWVHLKESGIPVWIEVSLTTASSEKDGIIHVIWRDIDAIKDAQAKLLYQKNQMEEMINCFPVAIVRAEIDNTSVGYFNQHFHKLFGWSLEEINTMDKWFSTAYPDPSYREEIITGWADLIEETSALGLDSSTHSIPSNVTCKDGSVKICDVWYHSNAGNVFGIFHDVTFQKNAEKQLLEKNKELKLLSSTDGLTGLLNRVTIESLLRDEIYRTGRYGNSDLAMIMFDLDHFKEINDSYGHQKGDEVLRMVSKLMGSLIRASDKAGRWGGEEFVITCPNTNLQGALIQADKLRQSIADAPIEGAGRVTASFGVVQFIEGETADSLISRADSLLYEAKDQGRNLVVG